MHCIYIFHTFIIYDFIFMLYFISFYPYSLLLNCWNAAK